MKKLISLLIFFCIMSVLIVSVPVTVNAQASGTCGDNITWNLNDNGTLTISGYGAMSNYSSPSQIPWYQNRLNIKNIILLGSIKTIGNSAFYMCSNVNSISIPSTVFAIGARSFYGCNSLNNIILPEDTKSILDYAFFNCKSLSTINIPKNVNEIGSDVFWGCSSLKEITVDDENTAFSSDGALYNKEKTILVHYPAAREDISYTVSEGVTILNRYSFYSNKFLSNISLPKTLSSIGSYSFYKCTALKKINIDNNYFCTDHNVLFTKDKKVLIKYLSSENNTDYYCMPNTVNTIAAVAFADCSNLTHIIMPACAKNIGNSAFSDCVQLESINIPIGITAINDSTFYNCNALKEVYYNGDEVSWNKISILTKNDPLKAATIHYCVNYENKILKISASANILSANLYVSNNTDSKVTGMLYVAVYNSNGKLKGITSQQLQLDSYSNTGVDVQLENYQFSSGDYTKSFIWKSFDSFAPICKPDIKYIDSIKQ